MDREEPALLRVILIVAGILLGLAALGMVFAYFGLWEKLFP